MANDKPGKISDDEILRRAAAIQEQRRVEGVDIGSSQHLQLTNGNVLVIAQQAHTGAPLGDLAYTVFLPHLRRAFDEYKARLEAITDGNA